MKHRGWLCLALALTLLCVPVQAAGPAEELYAQAVEDAKTIEPEELLPLKTTLTRDDPYAQWNQQGDQVLVCTWNDTPEDYPDGADVTVGEEAVWVFSGPEFEAWYAANAGGVEDWELRLCQLLGLPPDTGYTHFTTLWAAPEDLLRPAFDPDVTTSTMTEELTGEDWYQTWFEGNAAASYGQDGYPWTRLGYTYDWADNGTEYGLTEFILPTGAKATVERTVTTQAYLDSLETAQSNQAAAQSELDELNGKRLGVPTGSVFDRVALDRLPDAQMSYFNAQPDIVTALLAGKIDAMITDEPMARDIVNQTPGLRLIPELFRTDSYAFAFPLDHTALRDEVNTVLAELKSDGILEEMDARWFGEDNAAKVLPDLTLTGEKGVIRFATSTSCAPFAYVKDGQIVGYDIEVAVRICHKLGYSLEITDMDSGAMVPGIQAGKFDMGGACLTVTEERKQSVLFSEADYTGGIVAIVRDHEEAGGGGLWSYLKDGFYKTFLLENRWKLFVQGLGVTLLISVISAVLGTLMGFGLCMARRSRHKWLNGPVRLLVRIVQGVPVLVLLMILYFLVLKNLKSGVVVAVAGFSINFAAYVSEMMRTGIETVDAGQLEAAQALGFSRARAFWKVTAPQAIRTILPVYRGEFISMVKMTSVVGYITIQDLTRMSDIVRGLTYDAFFSLISTAIIYFALANLMAMSLSALEKRLDPKRRKRIVKGVVMA